MAVGCGHQLPGQRVFPALIHRRRRQRLDRSPTGHHRHGRGQPAGDVELVRDHDHGQPSACPQIGQQGDNALGGVPVQGARRLVGNQHVRVGGQGRGEQDPLPHPPGQGPGALPRDLFGVGQPDLAEQLQGPAAGGRTGQARVPPRHAGDHRADTAQRVERAAQILRDVPHTCAAQVTQLRLGRSHQLAAAQPGRPGDHGPHVGGEQAEDRQHEHGLARPARPHQRRRLPGVEREVHPVDHPTRSGQLHRQATDVEQHARPARMAAAVRTPVAQATGQLRAERAAVLPRARPCGARQVLRCAVGAAEQARREAVGEPGAGPIGEHRAGQGDRGHGQRRDRQQPRGAGQVRLGLHDHRPPLGDGRAGPETEVAEGGHGHDHLGGGEAEQHHHRPGGRWHQVAGQDVPGRGAEQGQRLRARLTALDPDLGADHPGVRRPGRDGQGQGDAPGTAPQHTRQDQAEQQRRQPAGHIHQPQQHPVDGAAGPPRDQTDHPAQEQTPQDGQQHRDHRTAGSRHQPCQFGPAQVVAPQEQSHAVPEPGGLQDAVEVGQPFLARGQPGPGHPGDEEVQDHAARHQPPPGQQRAGPPTQRGHEATRARGSMTAASSSARPRTATMSRARTSTLACTAGQSRYCRASIR